jgi:hypothetical protein
MVADAGVVGAECCHCRCSALLLLLPLLFLLLMPLQGALLLLDARTGFLSR